MSNINVVQVQPIPAEGRVFKVPQGRSSWLWIAQCPCHGGSDEVFVSRAGIFPRRWFTTKKAAQAALNDHLGGSA
jgi:hypothetical protein